MDDDVNDVKIDWKIKSNGDDNFDNECNDLDKVKFWAVMWSPMQF